jgi:hypothetical protein
MESLLDRDMNLVPVYKQTLRYQAIYLVVDEAKSNIILVLKTRIIEMHTIGPNAEERQW